MEKKLAVIVDNKEEVTTGMGDTELCSSACDVAMETCSSECHDTCGKYMPLSKAMMIFYGTDSTGGYRFSYAKFICIKSCVCRNYYQLS